MAQIPLELFILIQHFLSPISYLQSRQMGPAFRLKNLDREASEVLDRTQDLALGKTIYLDKTFPHTFSVKLIESLLIKSYQDDKPFFELLYSDSIHKNFVMVLKVLIKVGCVDKLRGLLVQDKANAYILMDCLQLAIRINQIESVKVLIEYVDPSKSFAGTDINSIVLASYYGHTEICRLLLADPRIDPSIKNNSSIAQASLRGHTETVRLLLTDARVDSSTRGDFFPLRYASRLGHEDIVFMLLDRLPPHCLEIAKRSARDGKQFDLLKKLVEMEKE